MNGDLLIQRCQFWQIGARLFIQADVPLLRKDQGGHGDKHLGHRSDMKFGVKTIGHGELPAGKAIGFLEDHVTILSNENGAAELLLFVSLIKESRQRLFVNHFSSPASLCMWRETDVPTFIRISP